MNSADTIFSFNRVSFGYPAGAGDNLLVKEFTGEIKKGELTVVIGRNGTGKSTILKSMVKLLPVLEGKIYIEGRLLDSIPSSDFPKIVSYVSTAMPHNPLMTVYELVTLGRFPFTNWLGSLKKDDHNEVMKALEVTGLLSHSHSPLYMISDGEKQRAMIARTIAQNSPIIILDEPTAFLDLPNKYELVSFLADLTSKGKTIIFSTHDTGIAFRFPDKLLILNDNSIITGAPEDLILSGSIGRIFHSKGFQFNRRSGDIEIVRKQNRFVSLSGNDKLQKEWTVRALKRAGYGVLEKSDSLLHIETDIIENDYIWVINRESGSIVFHSIYELISFLKRELTN